MTAGEPVIELRGVRKSFATPHGEVQVLHGVDLCVRSGEFVAITGPSGSGKTTLLNLAALLDQPTSGEIVFRGEAVSSLDELRLCDIRKRRVGMVFQRFSLLSRRSAFDNVLFRFRYLGGGSRDRMTQAAEALRMVGLSAVADRPARLLSSGEMQRVAIARAVVVRPDLLVADEPTGNLDEDATEAVMKCFADLNRSGITVLMVTHNPALLAYSSRHLACRDGRLEAA